MHFLIFFFNLYIVQTNCLLRGAREFLELATDVDSMDISSSVLPILFKPDLLFQNSSFPEQPAHSPKWCQMVRGQIHKFT